MITLLAMLVAVFLLAKKNSFTANFMALAAICFYFFYVYPLFSILGVDSFYYVGFYRSFDMSTFYFALVCGLIFLVGFFSFDVFLLLNRAKRSITSDFWSFKCEDEARFFFKNVFYLIFVFVFFYYLIGFLDSERAIKGYEVRRGEVQGSWLKLAIGLFVKSFFYGIVFCLIYVNRNKTAFLMLLFMVFYLMFGASGRAYLLFNIVLMFLCLFRLKVRDLLLFSVVFFFLFFPVIFSMKYIIYSIAVKGDIPDILAIYYKGVSPDVVVSNLGHPLISLVEVGSLIDLVGFRYFYDYIQGLFFYLRVIGLDAGYSLTYYNTEALIGKRLSIIPPGYLAFGYVQLGYLGVFFSGLFYRFVGFVCEYVYYSFGKDNEVLKFYFCYISAYTFYTGEVRVMVMNFFVPLLVLFLLRPKNMVKKVF